MATEAAPDRVAGLLAATAARYADAGRFAAGYVAGKLRHDPVFRQLAERMPLPAPIVDVGCGRGQTLVLLALAQPGLRALGLDWDDAKLASARRASAGLDGVVFERADVRTAVVPAAGTVLLLDVLHYQDPDAQDALLARAAAALAPGGVLYVRDVDADAGWRATLTVWQERLGRVLAVNRGPTLRFRGAAEVERTLVRLGLTTRRVSSGAGPLANVLIEARR